MEITTALEREMKQTRGGGMRNEEGKRRRNRRDAKPKRVAVVITLFGKSAARPDIGSGSFRIPYYGDSKADC
jgi:hypothetical protein